MHGEEERCISVFMLPRIRSTSTKWMVAAAMLTCALANAQTTGFGTISGSVTDLSQAIVIGAKITITNIATGVVREAVTNDSGYYEVQALIPGTYRVAVVQTGFQEAIREGITVATNARLNISFQLTVGLATQEVTVSAEAPLLNTESGQQGVVLTTKQVESLPASGSNPRWRRASLPPRASPRQRTARWVGLPSRPESLFTDSAPESSTTSMALRTCRAVIMQSILRKKRSAK
jgi:hypothetical protein